MIARQTTPLWRLLTWWALAFPIVMIAALATGNFFLLNWTHVLAGALWTGADIFMGFMVGPVMRRLEPPQRAAVISYLVPRTILYFPMVSLTTTTAGWFLAAKIGYLNPASAQFPWAIAALSIVAILTVQGLGIFLPNSIRMFLELRKPQPDGARIGRLARVNFTLAAVQGVFQVAIIFVMSHFVVG
jgi:uncharacterized membrane protein